MLQEIQNYIDKVKNLSVAVIGETITDEFISVSYEGQSMKSICPTFRLSGGTQRQQGGAAAIANHLRSFVKQVDLISNDPEEIVKTRYIDISDGKKHMEINKFDIDRSQKKIVESDKYDVVIVADFGHGYCDELELKDDFHLMCQTNSNNFGFNRISKWKNYSKKSVCIDLREASLQLNKKASFVSEQEVKELYNYELNTQNLFITLGSKGSLAHDGKKTIQQESFKSDIIDTIGAGDTFFAFVCLAAHIDTADLLLVPSLAASLSTTWLCNEKSVNPENLIQHAHSYL